MQRMTTIGGTVFKSFLTISTLTAAIILLAVGCSQDPGEKEYRSALREYGRGQYARARASVEKAINRQPAGKTGAALHNLQGLILWKLDAKEPAVDAFEEALRLDGELAEAAYNLGLLHREVGDSLRAVTRLREAAWYAPQDTRALEHIAAIYIREQHWEEAVKAIDEALERSPNHPRLLTLKGVADLALTGPNSAMEFWMRALEVRPDFPPALYNAAMTHANVLNSPEHARAFAEHYMAAEHEGIRRSQMEALLVSEPPATEPEVPEARVDPRLAGIEKLMAGARAAQRNHQPREALYISLQAVGAAEGDPKLQERVLREARDICYDQPKIHFVWGRFLFERGRVEEAYQALRKTLALRADWLEAQQLYLQLAGRLERYRDAAIVLTKVVEQHPDHPGYLEKLCRVLDEKLNTADEALPYLEQYIRKFPEGEFNEAARQRVARLKPAEEREQEAPVVQPVRETPPPETSEMLFMRGQSAYQDADWEAAEKWLLRAIELDGEQSEAYRYLAQVYLKTDRRREAARTYEKALKIKPDMTRARYNLAVLLLGMDQHKRALQHIERVLEEDAEMTEALYLAASICVALPDRRDEAQTYFEAFLEKAPGSPYAASAREWLRSYAKQRAE